MDQKQIDNLFSYHKPFGTQPERYETLRAKARELAHLINDSCPESREKSISITHLQNSVMMANASIMVNETEQEMKDEKNEAALQAEGVKEAEEKQAAA